MKGDHLDRAIALAESVRFGSDSGRAESRDGSLESSFIRYQFDEHGLRLSAEMTPGLYSILESVGQRLRIGPESVLAFVHASPDIQAACYAGDTKDCLISLTSGLIDLMSEQELAFVIGHELGHFLLGHGATPLTADPSVEGMMRRRSDEISADRVGMLACSERTAAFRALIKVSCGLDASHLRFDIGTYLEQIQQATSSAWGPTFGPTHPSLMIRCRALLWFEMSHEYRQINGASRGEPLDVIDNRVAKDLRRLVDGPAHKRIADAKRSLQIWMAVAASIRDGRIDKGEHALLKEELGPETCAKVLSFLSSSESAREIESMVGVKLMRATDFYESVAPEDYAQEAVGLAEKISRTFSQSDFQAYVDRLLQKSRG